VVENPLAFRRRLIFTEADPLRRTRMPRGTGMPLAQNMAR
jgi:hypothetical protein